MRRLFFVLLIIFAAAASLACLVRMDAGYVLVQFHGLSVETTVWIALVALLLALFGFYYFGRLLVIVADFAARPFRRRKPRATGGMLGAWRTRRRGPGTRGAIALLEGRWRTALRLLARGARNSDAPLLHHLLAARASEELGDRELARGFYQLAEETPGAALALRLERARAELRAGRAAEALALLDGMEADYAAAPMRLRLQLEALEALGDWARIASLLPEARRHAVCSESVLDALEERGYPQLLARAGTSSLPTAWKALPARVRRQPALLAAYAGKLARAGQADEAAKLLGSALKQEWSAVLVRAYGLLEAGDVKQRLRFAESQLGAHPHDPQLLLALGRLALRNRLWGKAREYFEGSIGSNPGAEALAELARLYEHLGESERARLLLQRAVDVSIGELPALPMPEKNLARIAAPVFSRL